MRHQKAFRKFSRSSSHRRALLRNMATSLLQHGKIETTVAKAKDLRRVSEKLITLAGEDTLHRRRQALSYLLSKEVVHNLFSEIGPRFKQRPGGYTRITRTRVRSGDAAEMAVIELVQEDYSPKSATKKTRKKKADGAADTASADKGSSKKKSAKASVAADVETAEGDDATVEAMPENPATPAKEATKKAKEPKE